MATGAAYLQVFKFDNPAGALTDISPSVTGVTMDTSRGAINVSVVGKNYAEYLAGISDATLTVEGIYDPASGAAGSIFAVAIHGTATQTFSYEWHPQGTASGKPKFSGESVVTSYSPGGAIDDAITFSAELQNTGTVTVGTN